jgi:ribosomal-protein-alanine N-acetyltransferase
MGPAVLEALLAEDRSGAARLLSCRIPPDFSLAELPLQMWLGQMRDDPSIEPWLVRAMIDRAANIMIGHIGFHSPPRPTYLAQWAADGVEMGYTVHSPNRRQGYAREAALALMQWAYTDHSQRCFVLSVSPQNPPSTAMAESLGFTPCGSHIDDEDGLEIIFVRRFEQWPADWQVEGAG